MNNRYLRWIHPIKRSILSSICVFFILFSNKYLAQTEKFDSIYFETAVNIAAKDVNKAIKIADSLFHHSTLELHKVKSLMLSSSLFQQKGDIKKSVQYAEKADKLAVKHKLYDWEARIAGFLSTQYRLMGLYEEGEIYLEKGKNVSQNIENQEMKVLYLGLIYQETAYYEIEYENHKKALKAAVKADGYFKELRDERNLNYFQATNNELLGRICIGLKKWDDALKHYTEALDLLTKVTQENAMLSGFIYSGLGRVYFEKRELDPAFEYLQKAEKIVEESDYLELKIEVYKTLADYYQLTEEYDKHSKYNNKFIESLQLSEKKKKESIADFVNTTKSKGDTLAYNRNILLIVSIGLCVIIILIFLWHRKSKKRDFERFKLVMSKLKENQQLKQQPINEIIEKEHLQEQEGDKKKIMSEAIELKLLNDLEKFEKGTKFTDKLISLPTLAGMLNTNTKYLSYILNTHKNKDFSTYINHLRINYIIEKIENNNVFKNYKISVLAEECGFSSHSKFSAVFKSVTGFSPSTFLEYLEKSKTEAK